ncbi:MAG: prolyl oligopeptidase family serine peptidase, partial [Woeseiaceae bacterium]|nr:prolyl oligopeptidase family serine peptidase [Woeseiaceae bacterium]
MTRVLFGFLAFFLIAACSPSSDQSAEQSSDQPQAEATAQQVSTEDPFLWLEDVEGEDALAWVEEKNEVSVAYLEGLATYEPMRERNLSIYDSEDRIPSPGMRGDDIYNFWRDADNERGLWRRTTIDEYVAGDPEWETVLDLDALAAEEDEDWVWKGASCLRPEYRRCLLRLSRGGADAVVVREFDVESGFVDGGFFVEEGKTWTSWVDDGTIFIGGDFGEGTTTDSGYPRTYRVWERGEPLEEATEIFSGEQEDVAVGVYRFYDAETAFDVAVRTITFYTSTHYLYDDGDLELIGIPEDASFYGVMKGQMLVELKSTWTPEDVEYAQGALLSINFEQFMDGDRDFEVLVEPTETSAIRGIRTTRDYVLVNELDNVVSQVSRFEFVDGAWTREPIEIDGLGTISIMATDDQSNVFFFSYEDFLSPDTLFVASDGGRTIEPVQSLPEFYDSTGMTVEQSFATSADGTRVPYFVIYPDGFEANGDTPTLIYGYGGFEVSIVPSYNATVGHSWLERGGVYVVANIRGGGEYGPAWHQA